MRRIAYLSMAILSLSAVTAYALLPSHFLIKSIAKRHEGFKSVRVVSTVRASSSDPILFKEMTTFDTASETLRSHATTEQGVELFSIERKLGLPKSGGFSGPIADYILFESNVVPLIRALVANEIPVKSELELSGLATEEERQKAENMKLERWNGHFAYAIGGRVKNPRSGQLWIEKDSFLPLRIFPASASGQRGVSEVQLQNYPSGGYTYPNVIALLEGESSVLRAETQGVNINVSTRDSRPIANGLTQAGQDADSAVRDLIRLYYTYVR